jgi:hypothetical protein
VAQEQLNQAWKLVAQLLRLMQQLGPQELLAVQQVLRERLPLRQSPQAIPSPTNLPLAGTSLLNNSLQQQAQDSQARSVLAQTGSLPPSAQALPSSSLQSQLTPLEQMNAVNPAVMPSAPLLPLQEQVARLKAMGR